MQEIKKVNPFGEEWEQEMMKFKKSELVEQLRKSSIIVHNVKAALPTNLKISSLSIEMPHESIEGNFILNIGYRKGIKDLAQYVLQFTEV